MPMTNFHIVGCKGDGFSRASFEVQSASAKGFGREPYRDEGTPFFDECRGIEFGHITINEAEVGTDGEDHFTSYCLDRLGNKFQGEGAGDCFVGFIITSSYDKLDFTLGVG